MSSVIQDYEDNIYLLVDPNMKIPLSKLTVYDTVYTNDSL